MKYINGLVFLSLLIFVAGCQKNDNQAPKKGPTKLETRKSAAQGNLKYPYAGAAANKKIAADKKAAAAQKRKSKQAA